MRGLKLDDKTTTDIQTFEMCVRRSIRHVYNVHETRRHVTPEWREFYDKAYANVELADRHDTLRKIVCVSWKSDREQTFGQA